jgi:hypothetical protein
MLPGKCSLLSTVFKSKKSSSRSSGLDEDFYSGHGGESRMELLRPMYTASSTRICNLRMTSSKPSKTPASRCGQAPRPLKAGDTATIFELQGLKRFVVNESISLAQDGKAKRIRLIVERTPRSASKTINKAA